MGEPTDGHVDLDVFIGQSRTFTIGGKVFVLRPFTLKRYDEFFKIMETPKLIQPVDVVDATKTPAIPLDVNKMKEELIEDARSGLFKNIRKALTFLFPDSADVLTEEFVSEHITIPMVNTIFAVVRQLNGWEDTSPFLRLNLAFLIGMFGGRSLMSLPVVTAGQSPKS